jgi:hypothetical protein
MQEFEGSNGIKEAFSGSGYSIKYKQKHGDGKIDGCAIFWKSKKFELINSTSLNFNIDMDSQVFCKPQIALFVVLKLK